MKPILNLDSITPLILHALQEDIGTGDVTTNAIIPLQLHANAYLRTREECIVAGLPVVATVFAQLAPGIIVTHYHEDGDWVGAATTLAHISGNARAILTGERTALNFLQRLSGIATLTRHYVNALGLSRTRLLDTRKTTPGLRQLEKYAVAIGGGSNHRMGLYDRVMIKDNHRDLIGLNCPGGLTQAIAMCRQSSPRMEVEVEVENPEELREALMAQVDYLLLDNMSTADMIDAVAIRDQLHPPTLLEASGGITLERLPELAHIGLDFISVGALTHSATAIDIGLDLSVSTHYPDTP